MDYKEKYHSLLELLEECSKLLYAQLDQGQMSRIKWYERYHKLRENLNREFKHGHKT